MKQELSRRARLKGDRTGAKRSLIRTGAQGPLNIKKEERKERKEKKKNYVGRVTLPTSMKEKETHWLIQSREPPPPQGKKERQN
eukprot:1143221-Pelagomonas_calceolata.AAC.3